MFPSLIERRHARQSHSLSRLRERVPSFARRVRAAAAGVGLLILNLLLSACGLVDRVEASREGVAERCADILAIAFPGKEIEITKTTTSTPNDEASVNALLVRIEGVRTAVAPEASTTRNIVVECRFEGTIVTGFRWLAGPLH